MAMDSYAISISRWSIMLLSAILSFFFFFFFFSWRRKRGRVSWSIGRPDAIFVKSFPARSYRTERTQARNYRPFWTKIVHRRISFSSSLRFLPLGLLSLLFRYLWPCGDAVHLRETLPCLDLRRIRPWVDELEAVGRYNSPNFQNQTRSNYPWLTICFLLITDLFTYVCNLRRAISRVFQLIDANEIIEYLGSFTSDRRNQYFNTDIP